VALRDADTPPVGVSFLFLCTVNDLTTDFD
jgi:hypothetical protein